MRRSQLRLGQWVRATWQGWTLGIVLTIAAAFVGDAIGLRESQALLGVAMGAGVGLMQKKVVAGFVSNPRAWVWSSIAGLAAPFLIFDLSRAAGFQMPYSLYVAVALGGLCAGLCQSILLRSFSGKSWTWVLASIAGWSLAAGSASGADRLPRALSFRGLPGAGIYLAVTLAGGLILGVVTGVLLVRLDRRES